MNSQPRDLQSYIPLTEPGPQGWLFYFHTANGASVIYQTLGWGLGYPGECICQSPCRHRAEGEAFKFTILLLRISSRFGHYIEHHPCQGLRNHCAVLQLNLILPNRMLLSLIWTFRSIAWEPRAVESCSLVTQNFVTNGIFPQWSRESSGAGGTFLSKYFIETSMNIRVERYSVAQTGYLLRTHRLPGSGKVNGWVWCTLLAGGGGLGWRPHSTWGLPLLGRRTDGQILLSRGLHPALG